MASPFHRLLPLLSLLLTLLLAAASASAEPRVHVVAQGHTLGKIAKRYHVSIEQLCAANRMKRNVRLKVGQRVVIPDGTADTSPAPSRDPAPAPTPRAGAKRRVASAPNALGFTTHRVAQGHTLAKIARRYLSDVDAIRQSNQLTLGNPLRVGQCLKVPLTPRSPNRLRTRRLPCLPDDVDIRALDDERMPANPFAARPDRPGVVRLVRGNLSWSGRVLDRHGAPLPESLKKINQLLFDRRTSDTHATDPRLLPLLVQVSDHFGGRTIRVVSGYREESSNHYTTRSNHALGRAIDITIPGVPNEVLRSFCQTFQGTGVGYYPNSSFVHLDVRSVTTHWTDISGPGEPPQYTSVRAGHPQSSALKPSRAKHSSASKRR